MAVKKRRGRPRKATSTTATKTGARRGRPRKATASAPASAPAKRRGRPRKATATATASAPAKTTRKKTARKLTITDCGDKLMRSRLVGGYALKKRVRKPKMTSTRRRRTSK